MNMLETFVLSYFIPGEAKIEVNYFHDACPMETDGSRVPLTNTSEYAGSPGIKNSRGVSGP
jgi:hypothetical protein